METEIKKTCLFDNSRQVMEGKGKNIIPPPVEKSLWLGFLEKFKDPIIVVLLVVFFFSVGVSLYEILFAGKGLTLLIEPLGVLFALLLATGVGFVFEVKAEREFNILNKKKDERKVKVFRWPEKNPSKKKRFRPQLMLILKSDVVVGDIVRLESGDEVPADGVILESESLIVDESAYTGEMYASKTVNQENDIQETAYPSNFLLRGSIVLEGNCLYRVTSVGMDTEEGKGVKIIQEENTVKTPLNEQLDTLGQWITKASYLIAILIIIGRFVYYFFFDSNNLNNRDALDIITFTLNSIMIAVTLIVVAVPEGLPMSITISLALSMRKMLKENNLVRKLHACETMGATTVICTDKTGTLTQNKLRVMDDSEDLYSDIDLIARCISVNSTAELSYHENGSIESVGNPTESSLLYWLKKKNKDYQEYRDNATIIKQIAFTPELKYMVTVASDDETCKTYKYLKGAPEIVLDMCDEIAGGRNRQDVLDSLTKLQQKGRRTLAFAVQNISENENTPLVFLGFVGMADPLRNNVRDAVVECQKAGVNVIMITGDVALTARQIAFETGIIDDDNTPMQVITGAEFEKMSDDEIKTHILPSLKVLSRAKPSDKARLVTLLQETGQVVAVTGDGTNDAPALKKAQVGLSMGDGTSRAKEASDITIIDNSFTSINTAILWGRSLYLNIKRFILFQMTINVCACLIVLFGAFIGLDSPLNVTQMLWVNLIMDTFAAMALSSLPADSKVMKDKPRRPGSHIIDRKMAFRILFVGMLFFIFLFGLWQLLWHYEIHSVGDLLKTDIWKIYFDKFLDFSKYRQHLSEYELGIFFTCFVLLQFWNLFNARYYNTNRSLFRDLYDIIRKPNSASLHFSTGFVVIVFVILLGQILIENVLGDMFGVSPLTANDWLLLVAFTSPILIVGEIIRIVREAFTSNSGV